jgi:hypothetical protein
LSRQTSFGTKPKNHGSERPREHHADLIFDTCDRSPCSISAARRMPARPPKFRVHKEVVSAYLGG